MTPASRCLIGTERKTSLFEHAAFTTSAGSCLSESDRDSKKFHHRQEVVFLSTLLSTDFQQRPTPRLIIEALQQQSKSNLGEAWGAQIETKKQPPTERLPFACGQLQPLTRTYDPRNRYNMLQTGCLGGGSGVRQTAFIGSEKRLTRCFRVCVYLKLQASTSRSSLKLLTFFNSRAGAWYNGNIADEEMASTPLNERFSPHG